MWASLLGALLGALLLAWSPVRAAAPGDGPAGVPLPVLPKATGKHCVMPTEWMRKNHMKLLFHERWITVHDGIFIKGRSMEDCLSCHVHRLADGQWPKPTSRKFFCQACHAYAAVKIDCFECHASHPVKAPPGVGPDGGNPLESEARAAGPDAGLTARTLTPMPIAQDTGGGAK